MFNPKAYLFFASAALVIFLIGCSPKVRSFFFDGVPVTSDTTGSALAADTLKTRTVVAAESPVPAALKTGMTVHLPYKNNKCASCHVRETPGKFVKEQPQLCYTCHEPFDTLYPVVHGPVGYGKCMICHLPHASKNKSLLIQTGQDLCYYCHEQSDVLGNKAHSGIADCDCIECHDPHGSKEKFLLK